MSTLSVDDQDIDTDFRAGEASPTAQDPDTRDADGTDGDAADTADGDATDGDALDAADGDATDGTDADGEDA